MKMTENLNANPNERLYLSAEESFWELKKTVIPTSDKIEVKDGFICTVKTIVEPIRLISEFTPAYGMCAHGGQIYAATKKGLMKVNPEEKSFEKFIDIPLKQIVSFEDRLYTSSSDKVYEIIGNKARDIDIKRDKEILQLCSYYSGLYDRTKNSIHLTLEDKDGNKPLVQRDDLTGIFSTKRTYFTTFTESWNELEVCDMGKRVEERHHPCKTYVHALDKPNIILETFYNCEGLEKITFDGDILVKRGRRVYNKHSKETYELPSYINSWCVKKCKK